MTRWLVASLAALFVACGAQAAVDPPATAALHALFDRQWEAAAERYPEAATFRGDLRYNDRLTDQSEAAIAAWDAQVRQWLAEARAIDPERLDAAQRLPLELFIGRLRREVALQPFTGYRDQLLGALGGLRNEFAALMQAAPVRTREQAEQLLRRMAAYPRQMNRIAAELTRW